MMVWSLVVCVVAACSLQFVGRLAGVGTRRKNYLLGGAAPCIRSAWIALLYHTINNFVAGRHHSVRKFCKELIF